MDFILMNKDRAIQAVKFIDGIARTDRQLTNIFDSKNWLSKRFQSVIEQDSLKAILNSSMTSIDEFYAVTKGLSLNDTFWLKPEGCRLTWKDVNPYTNPICTDFASSVLQAMKSGIIHNVNRTISSPDFALTGQYDKKWKRIDGKTYLIKAGTPNPYESDIVGNEPFSEYIAYLVGSMLQLGDKLVQYDLIKQTFQNKTRIATKCELFTSENVGFIPNEFINKGGKTDLEFAKYHNQLAMYLQMCLLDSLILNIDRHAGNFGYYMKNEEYLIGKMSPIFDNNLSLLCKDSIRDKDPAELVDIVLSKKPYKQMCPAGNNFQILGVWASREMVKNRIITPQQLLEILRTVGKGKYNLYDNMSIKMGKRRTEIVEWVVRYNAMYLEQALRRGVPYANLREFYRNNFIAKLSELKD